MDRDTLKSRYKGKLREQINKAIRAELPGGDEILDGLCLWQNMRTRKEREHAPREEIKMALLAENLCQDIKEKMVEEIRKRYNLDESSQDVD